MKGELGTHQQIINAGFLAKRDINYYLIQMFISLFYIKKLKFQRVAKSQAAVYKSFFISKMELSKCYVQFKIRICFSTSDLSTDTPQLAT